MNARVFVVLVLLFAVGCGGSGGSGGQGDAPGAVATPSPATPTAAPTPSVSLLSRFDASGNPLNPPDAAAIAAYRADTFDAPSLDGVAKIATNFDRTAEVVNEGVMPPEAGDPLGAFRMTCQAGQINADDPIVYPGKVGGSPHLHQWFGNTAANALSTYRSLRTTGEGTCNGPLNRSAYWMPAMIRGDDMIIRPDYITVYYKRYPKTASECRTTARECISVPRGLRYVFGFDMKRMHESQPENMIFHWKCVTPQNTQRGDLTSRFDTLDCPAGNLLIVTLEAPNCWDGVHLDSADHRSHMAYQQFGQGPATCPATHPYLIPQFTLGAAYSIEAGEDIRNWYLHSDRMAGMQQMAPGSTFHSDWYGAWDDDTLAVWVDNCIDRKLNCSAGELGDGTMMKHLADFDFRSPPRLINPRSTASSSP